VCAEHSGLSAEALEISMASEKIFIVMVGYVSVFLRMSVMFFFWDLTRARTDSRLAGLLF
jgi:hypothetical protein